MSKLALAWLISGLCIALLSTILFDYLWILGFVPLLIWTGCGLALLTSATWQFRNREQRRRAAYTIVLLIVGAAQFIPLNHAGQVLTTQVRFRLNRTTYDRLIERVTRTSIATSEIFEGNRYVVDAGPPLRVAFIWPGGITDNWCGVVYDPSGRVMKSADFNGDWSTWKSQVPPDVIGLFGGDLIWCERLDEPYFHCCFT